MAIEVKKSIFEFLHFDRPTKDQKKVLQAMENFAEDQNLHDFLILCGAAGTGKTSITAALIGYLNNQKKRYRIAAPTGRAARIIGRKANTTTSTIHSLIYTPDSNTETGVVSFKLKQRKDPDPLIYIIDEASMISKNPGTGDTLFETERGVLFDLIRYIKSANSQNKIVFLGDRYQLPPVGEEQSYALNKSFLETTFNMKGYEFLLTEVKRQEDGSYILTNATEIRKAIENNELTHSIDGKKSGNIFNATRNYTQEYLKNGPENAVAIGVSHKANKYFNDLVRTQIFGNAKKTLESGDLLMVQKNWNRNECVLYNGDHVQLISVDWSLQEQVAGLHFVAVKVKLLFAETETIIEDYLVLESVLNLGGKIDPKLEIGLRKERYIKNKVYGTSKDPADDRYVGALHLAYGHAITCNKAQGGEWKKVFINTLGIPSLKWQYTAVTRAINEIETFGNQYR